MPDSDFSGRNSNNPMIYFMRSHWKTTLGGALTAFGLAVGQIDPAWMKRGMAIAAAGGFFTALFAADRSRKQAVSIEEKPATKA